MFLAGVDISKTAYFIKAQSVWQMVTKLIPYDDVTRFDGIDQIIRETVVSNCEISRTAVFCHFFSAIKEYSGLVKYIPFYVFTGALPDLVIKLEHGRASNG